MASDLSELIAEDPKIERLGSGYGCAEGPIWNPDGFLLFSDIVGNTRYRWDERDGTRAVAHPTNKANGMTLDAVGQLVVCEHTTSVVARMEPGGTGTGREVVASHFGGKELNSPNDVVVSSAGWLYFTDPTSSRQDPEMGLVRDQDLDFQGVFRVNARGGEPELLTDAFKLPNGLCFGLDERVLYVCDTLGGYIYSHEVKSDGTLALGQLFAEGIAKIDGMKCDQAGNLWVTGPTGLWIYDPTGRRLGVVKVPGEPDPNGWGFTNLHWGGDHWGTLFVCTSNAVYRIETRTAGRREPFMTV